MAVVIQANKIVSNKVTDGVGFISVPDIKTIREKNGKAIIDIGGDEWLSVAPFSSVAIRYIEEKSKGNLEEKEREDIKSNSFANFYALDSETKSK